jgi:anti-sigma regulatory factor (Ser/Thr protein kinase)
MQEYLEFALILPVGPEAELVAVSATDRIAGFAGFNERTLAEVRLAVFEVCVNAFERNRSPDTRINLTFVLGEHKLLVIGRNFSRGLEAIPLDPARILPEMEKLGPGRWVLMQD